VGRFAPGGPISGGTALMSKGDEEGLAQPRGDTRCTTGCFTPGYLGSQAAGISGRPDSEPPAGRFAPGHLHPDRPVASQARGHDGPEDGQAMTGGGKGHSRACFTPEGLPRTEEGGPGQPDSKLPAARALAPGPGRGQPG
jgi:hypothetical protein